MITKEHAQEILQEKISDNLVIVDSFENPNYWCFGLGFITDYGEIIPLVGNSTIKINKETGEMENSNIYAR